MEREKTDKDKIVNMSNLNLIDEIGKVSERINEYEELLGKGAAMPSNSSNSGPRKILHSTQFEQRLELLTPEVPLLGSGFENQFGYFSSSFVSAETDYVVLAKIPKFSFMPDHHYFMIVQDMHTGMYDVIERVVYNHITETYGYLYNNKRLDNLRPGSVIEKGTVIKKSTSFDEFNNRMDGIDLNVAYLSNEYTKEDGIILLDEAAEKLAAPLPKKVTIVINDNHIPLNLYGNMEIYKSIPDIGEYIRDGIFMGIRIEKKEESLFSQSVDKLRKLMISDEKYLLEGQVVDIDIYCNNPDTLEGNYHWEQLKFYHNIKMEFLNSFVNTVRPLIEQGNCSHKLQKMYYNNNKILEGGQYLKDKPFSNIILEVTILDKNTTKVGDKITNRYGGKGVISRILPKEEMPTAIIMGEEVQVDMIYNSSTCVNRENAGQLLESSTNYIGTCISKYMKQGVLSTGEYLDMYDDFLSIVAPAQREAICEYMNSVGDIDRKQFIDDIIEKEGIYVSQKPITEVMTIDKLSDLYAKFPWIKQAAIMVPQKDSNGNIRRVRARRDLVIGKQYIYRLKQYAEEKFSAVSLSSTNIRNENSRSNAKKSHKSPHSKTPIKFLGEMETHDLVHVGVESAIINLMLHSASPHGRRLCEELLTGDPFNINIKLDDRARNRSVEILNAYLTTMGLRLEFKKIPKTMTKAMIRLQVPAMVRIPQHATTAMTRAAVGEAMPIRHMDRMHQLEQQPRAMMRHAMKRV